METATTRQFFEPLVGFRLGGEATGDAESLGLRERIAVIERFVDRNLQRIDVDLVPFFRRIDHALSVLHELEEDDPTGQRTAEWTLAFALMDSAFDDVLQVLDARNRRHTRRSVPASVPRRTTGSFRGTGRGSPRGNPAH